MRNEGVRRFVYVKRDYYKGCREKDERVAAMDASAARANKAFVFMSRMRRITASVVGPAERAGNNLRNTRDVTLEVASSKRPNNESDRL